MIEPEIIEELKKANYPFRKLPVNLEVIPHQTYREPSLDELIDACGKELRQNDALGNEAVSTFELSYCEERGVWDAGFIYNSGWILRNGKHLVSREKTKKIAVAKLFIALNTK